MTFQIGDKVRIKEGNQYLGVVHHIGPLRGHGFEDSVWCWFHPTDSLTTPNIVPYSDGGNLTFMDSRNLQLIESVESFDILDCV